MSKYTLILIMSAFAGLVVKSFLGGMGIAEALTAVGCVTYFGFIKYTEWHAVRKVEKNYEERLRSLENKLALLSGTAIINQKGRR
jgi:hypothetical protein